VGQKAGSTYLYAILKELKDEKLVGKDGDAIFAVPVQAT